MANVSAVATTATSTTARLSDPGSFVRACPSCSSSCWCRAGNKEADDDIRAFYRARDDLLRMQQAGSKLKQPHAAAAQSKGDEGEDHWRK